MGINGKTRKLATLAISVVALRGLGGAGSHWRSPEPVELAAKLQERVPRYDLRAASFPVALLKVAGDFKLPMGIEWKYSASTIRPLTVSRENATVREIIEGILAAQPGYELRVEDGVLRVSAAKPPADGRTFLKLRVGEFRAQNVPLETATKRLRELAKAIVSPPHLAHGESPQHGTGFSQGIEVEEPVLSLDVQDASVDDVLDALALASDKKVWVVTYAPDSATTRTGFWRTVSLWNDRPIPDDEQPVWDFLRWGQVPPMLAPTGSGRSDVVPRHD
jgi:hypothetical protein